MDFTGGILHVHNANVGQVPVSINNHSRFPGIQVLFPRTHKNGIIKNVNVDHFTGLLTCEIHFPDPRLAVSDNVLGRVLGPSLLFCVDKVFSLLDFKI
jgi:hypothetical protein